MRSGNCFKATPPGQLSDWLEEVGRCDQVQDCEDDDKEGGGNLSSGLPVN